MTGEEWVFQQLSTSIDLATLVADRIFPHFAEEVYPFVIYRHFGGDYETLADNTLVETHEVRIDYYSEDYTTLAQIASVIRDACRVHPARLEEETSGSTPEKDGIYHAWQIYEISLAEV